MWKIQQRQRLQVSKTDETNHSNKAHLLQPAQVHVSIIASFPATAMDGGAIQPCSNACSAHVFRNKDN